MLPMLPMLPDMPPMPPQNAMEAIKQVITPEQAEEIETLDDALDLVTLDLAVQVMNDMPVLKTGLSAQERQRRLAILDPIYERCAQIRHDLIGTAEYRVCEKSRYRCNYYHERKKKKKSAGKRRNDAKKEKIPKTGVSIELPRAQIAQLMQANGVQVQHSCRFAPLSFEASEISNT